MYGGALTCPACAPLACTGVVQRGISAQLQVFKTRHKGWAVRALAAIHAGQFVCEYVGEVITTDEAERRGVEYDKRTPTRRGSEPSSHTPAIHGARAYLTRNFVL